MDTAAAESQTYTPNAILAAMLLHHGCESPTLDFRSVKHRETTLLRLRFV